MGKITVIIPPVSEKAEFPLIFLLLFLPSYLNQQSLPFAIFDSPIFIIQSLLQSLLIFFLIRYLLQLRPLSHLEKGLADSVLAPEIRFNHGLTALGGLVCLYSIYSFILLPLFQHMRIITPPAEAVLITRGIMLIPALFTCFAAAAMEEFFFRGYAFFRLRQSGLKTLPALILVNIIFAAGHLYEGWPTSVFALISGIFLTFLVLKKISLFSLAAAHGIFNFSMILISYLRQMSF